MPGVDKLPWEFQLVFWLLFLFIAALCGFVVFWTKRYVDEQDRRSLAIEGKLSKAVDDVKTVSTVLSNNALAIRNEFIDFQKKVNEANTSIVRELVTIDAQSKVLSDRFGRANEAAQRIAVDLEKKSELSLGRVQLLEQNQTKIVTTITKLNEKLVLVSQKKNDEPKS